MNEKEASYLAGYIDADGAIGLAKQKDERKGVGYYTYRPMIQITSTNKEILQWIQSIAEFEEITTEQRERPNHRHSHLIKMRKQKKVEELLTLLIPFLRLKKRQAEILLIYVKRRQDKKSAKGWYNPYTTDDEVTYAILKELNRKGINEGATTPAEEMEVKAVAEG